jgi:hypothetical protein
MLLTAPLVTAQRQRWPDSGGGEPRGEAAPRQAQPRSEPRSEPRSQPRSEPRQEPRSQPRSEPRQQPQARERSQPARVPGSAREADAPARATADEGQRREGAGRQATPRGDRARGDNPRVGTAVPRQGPPPVSARRNDDWRDGRRYDRRGSTIVYNSYFTYPRRYFPFGYAGYGPGYYYYDRYDWHWYGDPYRDRFDYYRYGYPTGELRLDVDPSHAEVYVDGYYAGRVDDFDGFWQALTLEDGRYTIEIVAPGYEPLVFDIRIDPGRKITYRGDLYTARPGVR